MQTIQNIIDMDKSIKDIQCLRSNGTNGYMMKSPATRPRAQSKLEEKLKVNLQMIGVNMMNIREAEK
jgi:hypothetical protein